ncbi:MAG: hybrid sensor histidine kinase/response regulator [Rectinemataceae bacterium]
MKSEDPDKPLPTILVVDDQQQNLVIMGDLLMGDYMVKIATRGETALRIARSDRQPDLILLDIMMPVMDGYEVCRQLKADPATSGIPVIFLTARIDEEDERKGLSLGAVDYITKPINPLITLARIQNHMELKQLRDDLSAQVAARTAELEVANTRLRALDAGSQDYLRTISHELRTPANGILGIAELAIEAISDRKLRSDYELLLERSRERLLSAIDAALQLAELQSGSATIATEPVDLAGPLESCLDSLSTALDARGIKIKLPSDVHTIILANPELLRQVLSALLDAAGRLATTGSAITAGLSCADGKQMELQLSFEAPVLPDGLRRSFFDTFSYERASSRIEELGLALPLSAELARAMGGAVGLRRSEAGNQLFLSLRVAP